MNRRHFLSCALTALAGSSMHSFPANAQPLVPSRKIDSIRVGLIQMNGVAFDKTYNLAQAEKWTRSAAAKGARLVCTPECAVQGYPRVTYGPGTAFDDPKLVQGRARILAAAEPIPGPSTARFSALARELRLWIIFGMDENRHGILFNTAVLMNPQGQIAGKFSKVHLQNWMVASGVHPGDNFPVWEIDVDGVKTTIGVAICYDIQHPESALELTLGGAEVIFNPYCTNDFARPLLEHLDQTRALENRVFLARVDFGMPHNNGGSAIFDFEGNTQNELGADPGVLVGDFNLTALRKVRNAWNQVYGPENRRPSAYQRIPLASRKAALHSIQPK